MDSKRLLGPEFRGVGGPVEELAAGIDEVGDYVHWTDGEVDVLDVMLRSDPPGLFPLLSLRGIRD